MAITDFRKGNAKAKARRRRCLPSAGTGSALESGLATGSPPDRSYLPNCNRVQEWTERGTKLFIAADQFVEAALPALCVLIKERELALIENFKLLLPGNRFQGLLAAEAGKIDSQNTRCLPVACGAFHCRRMAALRFHPLPDFFMVSGGLG